jgi:hypothetical protein
MEKFNSAHNSPLHSSIFSNDQIANRKFAIIKYIHTLSIHYHHLMANVPKSDKQITYRQLMPIVPFNGKEWKIYCVLLILFLLYLKKYFISCKLHWVSLHAPLDNHCSFCTFYLKGFMEILRKIMYWILNNRRVCPFVFLMLKFPQTFRILK